MYITLIKGFDYWAKQSLTYQGAVSVFWCSAKNKIKYNFVF